MIWPLPAVFGAVGDLARRGVGGPWGVRMGSYVLAGVALGLVGVVVAVVAGLAEGGTWTAVFGILGALVNGGIAVVVLSSEAAAAPSPPTG